MKIEDISGIFFSNELKKDVHSYVCRILYWSLDNLFFVVNTGKAGMKCR